jgi:lysophospholipase L1-like esterase
MGFREKQYPVERRPGVRRIAVIGDSYTFGYGVDFAEIFSKRLEEKLNGSGQPYEVINFGVPGYNTTLELATLRESAAQFKPDLVIVGYVLNDTEIQNRRKDTAGSKGGTSIINAAHLALKDISMLYYFLAPKLGALAGALFNARYAVGGTKEIIRSFEDDAPGWIESRNALLGIAEEARAIGAPTLVVVFPMMVDSYPLAAAHNRITAFCREHGIAVLDLMSTLEGRKVSEMIVVLDGHPNGRMHRIFADRIYDYLSQNYAPTRNPLEASNKF